MLFEITGLNAHITKQGCLGPKIPLTWLRMAVAFLALMKSGVSVANANIPLPLISVSNAFLYSFCKQPH